MAMKTGISIRVGRQNVGSFPAATRIFQKKLDALQRQLGEMTRPFNEISPLLIANIKRRFDSGSLAGPPFRKETFKRSHWTMKAREAKSQNPYGPTLLASGSIRDAITRKDSPTKSPGGKQREVYRLVIGITGGSVPYHKEQLWGGTWEVPVFAKLNRNGEVTYYLDTERLDGAMSNQSFHGPIIYNYIKDEERTTINVSIPETNFLMITPIEKRITTRIFNKWFTQLGSRSKWSN